MDTNVVVLTGRLVSAAERTVGQQGRTLVELRLAVARPGRKGEGEAETVLPITIWAGDVGAAVRALPEGTPLTVLARISARDWTAPGGQTKTFVEVVADRVTRDVGAQGAPPAVAREPGPPPPAAPSSPSRARSRDDVPF